LNLELLLLPVAFPLSQTELCYHSWQRYDLGSEFGGGCVVQVLSVTENIQSLSMVEAAFQLHQRVDDRFFPEWYEDLPELSVLEQAELDRLKLRFMQHFYQGQITEGSVDRLLVSPLLDLVGFYEPTFRVETETSVEVTAVDGEQVYRGRIDVLVIAPTFWVVLVEEKASRISMETALPQALTYMAAHPNGSAPMFGLVTNGHGFAFLKLQQTEQGLAYGFSDRFTLMSRQNQLYTVFSILKVLKSNCD
jgi:hypothetical protein